MKRLAILGLFIGALAVAPAAHAGTISLTQAQLLAFVADAGLGVNVTNQTLLNLNPGVQLETIFEDPVVPAQTAAFKLTGVNIANTAGDVFLLGYLNSNSNPWTWTVSLTGGGGGSDSTTVGAGLTDVFGINLDGTPITEVLISVSGYFPGPPQDRVANSSFATVPDPGSSLFLMGLGLAGLGVWRKRS